MTNLATTNELIIANMALSYIGFNTVLSDLIPVASQATYGIKTAINQVLQVAYGGALSNQAYKFNEIIGTVTRQSNTFPDEYEGFYVYSYPSDALYINQIISLTTSVRDPDNPGEFITTRVNANTVPNLLFYTGQLMFPINILTPVLFVNYDVSSLEIGYNLFQRGDLRLLPDLQRAIALRLAIEIAPRVYQLDSTSLLERLRIQLMEVEMQLNDINNTSDYISTREDLDSSDAKLFRSRRQGTYGFAYTPNVRWM